MRWQGKIIGAIIGAIIGRWVGAILGALLGHQFDLQAERNARKTHRERYSGDPQVISAVFFRSVFAIMGYIAKADGRVSEREVDAARGVMEQMHLSPEQVQAAIRFFTEGKQPDFAFDRTVQELRQVCAGRHDLLRMFMEIQMRAALQGVNLQGPARSLIHRVGQTLGMSSLELAHMEAILRLQTGQRSSSAAAQGRTLADAYSLLEIQASASNAEVIKAYRRQMSRHHPDKLVANGLPESMMELAKERTQQIREAYETIRAHRGLK